MSSQEPEEDADEECEGQPSRPDSLDLDCSAREDEWALSGR